jgi:predicted amidohydrolase
MTEIISNTATFFAGFLQFDVKSGEIEKNLVRVSEGLAEISESQRQISPGIIVLPELWATGFAYDKLPELAGTTPDVLRQLQKLSLKYNVFIAGSLPEYSGNSYYNTLFISGPEGTVGSFQKQRLFAPMAEDTFFTPGNFTQPVHTSFATLGGLVCYDLRYPEILREQTALGANLLVIAAQWPAARIYHWRILLQARAIENQMFVVAANRCGISDDISFGGHSMIVGPDGTILLEAGTDNECRGVMLQPAQVSVARSLFSTVPTKTG